MFTATELVNVQAAADILVGDIRPIVKKSRAKAWPSMCDALAEWIVRFESIQVELLRMERTSWR